MIAFQRSVCEHVICFCQGVSRLLFFSKRKFHEGESQFLNHPIPSTLTIMQMIETESCIPLSLSFNPSPTHPPQSRNFSCARFSAVKLLLRCCNSEVNWFFTLVSCGVGRAVRSAVEG